MVRALLGLVGTLVGAQLTVTGAIGLAERIGLSEGFIGFSLVAIGTSLPELVTGVQAARQERDDLVLGIRARQNLFNSLAVGSVAALASSAPPPVGLELPVALMIGAAVLLLVLLLVVGEIGRTAALLLLTAYIAVLPLVA